MLLKNPQKFKQRAFTSRGYNTRVKVRQRKNYKREHSIKGETEDKLFIPIRELEKRNKYAPKRCSMCNKKAIAYVVDKEFTIFASACEEHKTNFVELMNQMKIKQRKFSKKR